MHVNSTICCCAMRSHTRPDNYCCCVFYDIKQSSRRQLFAVDREKDASFG